VRGGAIKMRFRTLNSNSRVRLVVWGSLVLLVRYRIATLPSSAMMPVKPTACRLARRFSGITLEWWWFESAILTSWAHRVDLALCCSPILQVSPFRQRKPRARGFRIGLPLSTCRYTARCATCNSGYTGNRGRSSRRRNDAVQRQSGRGPCGPCGRHQGRRRGLRQGLRCDHRP
jgi:hypothetical protein